MVINCMSNEIFMLSNVISFVFNSSNLKLENEQGVIYRNLMVLHFLKTYLKFYVILICLFILTVTTKSDVPAQYVVRLEPLT